MPTSSSNNLMEEYGFAGTDKVQEDNLRVLLDKAGSIWRTNPKSTAASWPTCSGTSLLQPLCCCQRSAPVDKKGKPVKYLV
ncbi:MAG: hypothetical protein R2830_17915 [Saprospiraceae bacterium]